MICIFSVFAGVFFIITALERFIFVLFSFAPTVAYFARKYGAFSLKAQRHFLYMRVCLCVSLSCCYICFIFKRKSDFI